MSMIGDYAEKWNLRKWQVRSVIGTVDTGLEFYRQVLALRAYRQQILTADIANASTPGERAWWQEVVGALAR